jgi:alpha-glucosidase
MSSAMRLLSFRCVGGDGLSILVIAVALAFFVTPTASSADELRATWERIFCQTEGAAENADGELAVASPNGLVRCVVSTDNGQLKLAIQRDGTPALESSPIRVSVDGRSLTDACRIAASPRFEIDETYLWRGVHATAVNRCNGATVSVESSEGAAELALEVRAFDDGVAYRYVIPDSEAANVRRVPDETTTFVLPSASIAWIHDLEGHYEGVFDESDLASLEAGRWAAPPLTVKLPGAIGYAAITEAALVNFSGMALRADGRHGFDVVLGHAHPASYPFRLRYPDDVERMQRPGAASGPITSPWRVILVAEDLDGLANSDVVHNLCPPPDEALFPQGIQTPWIRPGRAVWRYLDGGENTLAEVKNFNRWAGELGFEYQVVEGFWSRWSEEEIREAVDDARRHGVGLWFWRHSRDLRTTSARTEFFKNLSRWGVVGAKIDFFDHEHKDVVALYAALLEEAARHEIMVNFHGANKPTGEMRTWPNELTREAVKGMEARRLADRARHDATLPFTRYLAGPGDYTPVVFGERRGDTTAAHQIATAAAFNQPLLTYGAHPRTLLEHPAVEMIKSIPAVWDETIVLPQSAIGDVAALARRSGEVWYLVVVNGPIARNLEVPLAFLGPGNCRALVVRDDDKDPTRVVVTETTADRATMLKIDLQAGGGFIARFSAIPAAAESPNETTRRE